MVQGLALEGTQPRLGSKFKHPELGLQYSCSLALISCNFLRQYQDCKSHDFQKMQLSTPLPFYMGKAGYLFSCFSAKI